MGQMAKTWVEVGPYLEIGWFFVVGMAVCGGFGWWLDGKLGTGRTWFIVGSVVGIGLGFVNLYKIIKLLDRRQRADRRRKAGN